MARSSAACNNEGPTGDAKSEEFSAGWGPGRRAERRRRGPWAASGHGAAGVCARSMQHGARGGCPPAHTPLQTSHAPAPTAASRSERRVPSTWLAGEGTREKGRQAPACRKKAQAAAGPTPTPAAAAPAAAASVPALPTPHRSHARNAALDRSSGSVSCFRRAAAGERRAADVGGAAIAVAAVGAAAGSVDGFPVLEVTSGGAAPSAAVMQPQGGFAGSRKARRCWKRDVVSAAGDKRLYTVGEL